MDGVGESYEQKLRDNIEIMIQRERHWERVKHAALTPADFDFAKRKQEEVDQCYHALQSQLTNYNEYHWVDRPN